MLKKLEILSEFDERFRTKLRESNLICYVLLTVQNAVRLALLFIDNKQFVGLLDKLSSI